MDENRLLNAIGEISNQVKNMDEKFTKRMDDMDEKFNTMSGQINAMDEKFTKQIQAIDIRIDVMGEKFTKQIQAIDIRIYAMDEKFTMEIKTLTAAVNRTNVLYENKMTQIINLLDEDYGRVAAAVRKVSDYDEVKDKVSDLDFAVRSHNSRISKLEERIG